MSAVAGAAERLGRPELRPLLDELHRRFGDGATPVRIRLRASSDATRAAVADLLGSPRLPPESFVLPVRRLQEALDLGEVEELRSAVELAGGPVPDRRAARADALREREMLWTWVASEARARPVVTDPGAWVDSLRRGGVRGSVAEHRAWLDDVLAVLDALPAAALTLAELAQDVLGHPHALDAGRSRPAAVLDAISPATVGDRDAESTRATWESVGVAPDALSSTALSLGVRPGADHPLEAMLRTAADAAEPVVLTLSQLRRWPLPPVPAYGSLFVVENPSLLSAAAREGWHGPPIVCSSGRPTVAVLALVRQLTAGGATAYQHADLDPTGVAITAWLAERAGTRPWRMTTQDYLATLTPVRPLPTTAAPARHRAVPLTPWDPTLREAMSTRQAWTYEEQVRSELLARMRETTEGT